MSLDITPKSSDIDGCTRWAELHGTICQNHIIGKHFWDKYGI